MKMEGVCPVEARSGDMGRIQKCCCHCREKICVAKAQLEMKLARTMRETKKSFFKYINGKKQIRNNTGPFQDEDGLLTNRDMDMAECLMFLCLSSAQMMDQGGLSALSWRTVTVGMSNSQLTPKQQDLLLPMDACKSMGPHGII